MNKAFSEAAAKAPFDTAKLDRLMGEGGLDVLVVSSGIMSNIFWEDIASSFSTRWTPSASAAICPCWFIQSDRPEQTLYLGNGMETFEEELHTIPAPREDIGRERST